jgi:hypothetical protein
MFQPLAIIVHSKSMPSGYSGTPLSKKLGIKSGHCYLLYNEPKHYFNLFRDFPEDAIKLKHIETEKADFIHLFCTTEKELHETVTLFKPALKKSGMLWVSWSKGSSKIQTDLKREPIREYMLSIGLVDIKVAAIDDDWSGLKFVYRLKERT